MVHAYTTASSIILLAIVRGGLKSCESPEALHQTLNTMRRRLHVVVWGITTILVAPPIPLKLYGPAQGHCWIMKNKLGKEFRWISFYGPLWIIAIPINMGVYIYLIFKGRHGKSALIKNLRYFPVISVIGYIPATMKRIYDTFDLDDESTEFYLQCAMYFGLMSIGVFNAFLYGWLWFTGAQTDRDTSDSFVPKTSTHDDTTPEQQETYSHIHICSDEHGLFQTNQGIGLNRIVHTYVHIQQDRQRKMDTSADKSGKTSSITGSTSTGNMPFQHSHIQDSQEQNMELIPSKQESRRVHTSDSIENHRNRLQPM